MPLAMKETLVVAARSRVKANCAEASPYQPRSSEIPDGRAKELEARTSPDIVRHDLVPSTDREGEELERRTGDEQENGKRLKPALFQNQPAAPLMRNVAGRLTPKVASALNLWRSWAWTRRIVAVGITGRQSERHIAEPGIGGQRR